MVFTDFNYPFKSAALFIVIAGMSAASFASTASYSPATNLVFLLGANGIMSLGYVSTGERTAYVIAILNVIYVVMLRGFAKRSHRNMVEQIRLRLETTQLVDKLDHQRALAESANVAKSRFLAAASHDLRQPLQAVAIFSDLLNHELRNTEHYESTQQRQASTDALHRLFNTLLDISLLDASKLKPQCRDMPLSPLIERLRNEYQEQAAAQQLNLRTACSNLAVHSDPALLENILRNLISNALRYAMQGEVVVQCIARDDRVTIEVRDTGIGIPGDELESSFEEFHQVGNPKRDRQQGLGLGLAIVQRTAALLGATITVASEPEKGSSFTLTLPQAQAPTESNLSETHDGPLDGLVVAVVDDEAEIRDGFARLLAQWGCTPVIGDSLDTVEQALESLALQPDVVLTDYRLCDGQNGLQVIERLRARYSATLPALIITGESDPELLRQIDRSNLPVLSKPIAPARLRAFLLRQRP